jgi:hypothetical protein
MAGLRRLGKTLGRHRDYEMAGAEILVGAQARPANPAGCALQFHIDLDREGWVAGFFDLRATSDADEPGERRGDRFTTERVLERVARLFGPTPIYAKRKVRGVIASPKYVPVLVPSVLMMDGVPLEATGVQYALMEGSTLIGARTVRLKKNGCESR